MEAGQGGSHLEHDGYTGGVVTGSRDSMQLRIVTDPVVVGANQQRGVGKRRVGSCQHADHVGPLQGYPTDRHLGPDDLSLEGREEVTSNGDDWQSSHRCGRDALGEETGAASPDRDQDPEDVLRRQARREAFQVIDLGRGQPLSCRKLAKRCSSHAASRFGRRCRPRIFDELDTVREMPLPAIEHGKRWRRPEIEDLDVRGIELQQTRRVSAGRQLVQQPALGAIVPLGADTPPRILFAAEPLEGPLGDLQPAGSRRGHLGGTQPHVPPGARARRSRRRHSTPTWSSRPPRVRHNRPRTGPGHWGRSSSTPAESSHSSPK